MCLTIVLERHLLPRSNVKIRFNAASPGFVFQQRECATSRWEFLWKYFYSARIKFSRECYQDFASRQDSRRDAGEEFFSWRDPGEYRFLDGILAKIRGGNFSRERSRRENRPPRQDPAGSQWTPGILAGSRRDPGTCFTRVIIKYPEQTFQWWTCTRHITSDPLHLSSSGLNKEYNQTLARLIPEPVAFASKDSQSKPVFCNKKSEYTAGVIMTL